MSTPPAGKTLPTVSTQKPPLSYSAVAAKPSPRKNKDSPKQPCAVQKTPIIGNSVPFVKPSPFKAAREQKLSGHPTYAQAHLTSGLGLRLREAHEPSPPVSSPKPSQDCAPTPPSFFEPLLGLSNNIVYEPPHTRTEAHYSSAMVTGTFSKAAEKHSNAERSASAFKPVVPAIPIVTATSARILDARPGKINCAAMEANAAIPILPNFSSPPEQSGVGCQSGTPTLSDISQRRVLATTLSILRSSIEKRTRDDMRLQPVLDFLQKTCPVPAATVEYDRWFPAIEIAYWYPIDDHDWDIFQAMVHHTGLANEADAMLGVGATVFDQVNDKHRQRFPSLNPRPELYRWVDLPDFVELLAGGHSPEVLIRRATELYNLNKKYDINSCKKHLNTEPSGNASA